MFRPVQSVLREQLAPQRQSVVLRQIERSPDAHIGPGALQALTSAATNVTASRERARGVWRVDRIKRSRESTGTLGP